MFGVKEKFILNNQQKEKLLKGAEFLEKEIFTEVYYDNVKHSLALNDMWLCQRGQDFELKILKREDADETTDKFYKIEGEMAIREIFAIPVIGNFVTDLNNLGHLPFCKLTTTRQKLIKDGFRIDLEVTDFEGWQYQMVEIELMVDEAEEEIGEASEKIYDFAKKHGLEISHVNGKLIAYFKRKLPAQYAALLAAGVVKENK